MSLLCNKLHSLINAYVIMSRSLSALNVYFLLCKLERKRRREAGKGDGTGRSQEGRQSKDRVAKGGEGPEHCSGREAKCSRAVLSYRAENA